MAYADLDSVKAILGVSGVTEFDDRLAALNAVASAELDQALGLAVGSSFAASEADTTRTFYPLGGSDVLLLTPPIRSVTSLTVDGGALTAGTDYQLVDPAGNVWRAVRRLAGSLTGWAAVNGPDWLAYGWCGVVAITGQWADQGGAEPDPLLVEAANVIVAGYWRKDGAADGETSGADGLTFRPSNPWNDARVKRLLTAYGRALP